MSRPAKYPPTRRVQGVALVTALLVLALATTAAVGMTTREQFRIRHTSNLLELDQARQYALGAEGWARHILARDDNDTDGLADPWANVLPPVSIEGGQITAELEDLQGRLNINNLLEGGEINETALKRLTRLVRVLELEPTIVPAIVDWLDADIQPRYPDGAEDEVYLQRTPAHRAANQPLVSITELRLIEGIDQETYETLSPHVTALPSATAINVNTASAPVLRALAEEISEGDAEALIAARGEDGFADLDAFLEDRALAGREVETERLGVTTRHFRLTTHVQFGRARLRMRSLLQRDTDKVTILARSRGRL